MRISRRIVAIAVAAFLPAAALLPAAARGEVVESSANGFLVHNSISVRGSAGAAYSAFVEHVGDWWSPAHTFSGDPANLSIDPRPGGCLCEKLANGGGVQHLVVVAVAPGSVIRFSGAMGPLQAYGVAGSMTCTFAANGDSTTIDQIYNVGGYFKGGLDKIAPIADIVLRELLASLQSYINTGRAKRD
ncbi:MAG TPA: ATPase [Candidatus Kapabacteria bacterium]|nr:ATPase [Candidatus Kapabacteria bacterium]